MIFDDGNGKLIFVYFVVKFVNQGYLRLDDEGEGERLMDSTQATRFNTMREAKKAAWAFQAAPYEVFCIVPMHVDPEGETK